MTQDDLAAKIAAIDALHADSDMPRPRKAFLHAAREAWPALRDRLRELELYRELSSTEGRAQLEGVQHERDALRAQVERLKTTQKREIQEFNAGYEAALNGKPESDEPDDCECDVWMAGYAWARYSALKRHIAQLEEALRRMTDRVNDSIACERCEAKYGLDAVVPDATWKALSGKERDGYLCLFCMDEIAAEKGIEFDAVLHFAGRKGIGTNAARGRLDDAIGDWTKIAEQNEQHREQIAQLEEALRKYERVADATRKLMADFIDTVGDTEHELAVAVIAALDKLDAEAGK